MQEIINCFLLIQGIILSLNLLDYLMNLHLKNYSQTKNTDLYAFNLKILGANYSLPILQENLSLTTKKIYQ
ncbi:hypothetical protein SDC9_193008 [bioreactor metagenome]|uniref:Uncharacterized protein n=1 Tax=bioreactor metagenome TaxID=1076179 RepID=A0A645I2B5_9ZZZZ